MLGHGGEILVFKSGYTMVVRLTIRNKAMSLLQERQSLSVLSILHYDA